MASTDSRPVPLKNVAFRAVFPIYDNTGALVTGAAGLDSEVSKDQGTFADCTNEATEIATASGLYYLDLTSTEMNADAVAVIVKTSTTNARTTVLVFYPEETGDINVDITAVNGVSASANKLQLALSTQTLGTVDNTGFTPTATQFEASDITEATADHFIGAMIRPTSGALVGQSTTVTDYALSGGRGHFTISGFPSGETIANGVTFEVI